MARTTTKRTITKRTNNATSGKNNYKTASELGNKLEDVEILNVRKFVDRWDNDCCYFTLNLGFLTIYSMLYLVDKNGNGYITFPKEERKGQFYSTGFIDSSLTDFIVEEIEKNYL